MRHLLYIIPTLIALWMLDNGLSFDRYVGWERNAVRSSTMRWEQGKRAKVAIFGSSTSKDWLPASLAARVTGVRTRDVLDAHVNGCHQGCTWASVRTLLRLERRYEVAFFGTNLFQMCENAHSKRILQHQIMTPAADAGRLMRLYGRAEQPLNYAGRYIGMTLSGAYGDTASLQRWLAEDLYGEAKKGRQHRWARRRLPTTKKRQASCRYAPEDVAFKAAVSEALFDDLSRIAKHVFVLLLPDPTAGLDDPEHRRRWAAHRALHRRLADARPRVTLIDLTDGGVVEPEGFRDAIHLERGAMGRQRALFEGRMRAVGWPPPKTDAAGKPAREAPQTKGRAFGRPARVAPSRVLPGRAFESSKPSEPSGMPSKSSGMPSESSGMLSKSSGMPSESSGVSSCVSSGVQSKPFGKSSGVPSESFGMPSESSGMPSDDSGGGR